MRDTGCVTENSERGKIIAQHLAPFMKEAGFRKRGNAFNRAVADGGVHVVSLQLGRSEGFRTQVIPGFPSLHGELTVNLGVWMPRMNRTHIPFGDWITEAHCQVRYRLGMLMTGRDKWWQLSGVRTPATILKGLRDYGLPALDALPDEDSVIRAFEAGGHEAMAFPRALEIAYAFAQRGEHARAVPLLTEYLGRPIISKWNVPYLQSFLEENGWPELAGTVRVTSAD